MGVPVRPPGDLIIVATADPDASADFPSPKKSPASYPHALSFVTPLWEVMVKSRYDTPS